jgi:hypothetical protein
MKLNDLVKSVSPLEAILFIVFILYLVVPVQLPDLVRRYVDSPISIIVLFCSVVYLFLYTNPALGILAIFVVYELLRRSVEPSPKAAYVQYTAPAAKREADLREMNPAQPATLEEDVVASMAPIGRSDPINFVDSSFKPVSDNIHNAFAVRQ